MSTSADHQWSDYREFAATANLLDQQTLGSVLRNTFRIYGHYWPTVVGVTVLAILPFFIARLLLIYFNAGYVIIPTILQYLALMFTSAVLCIAISDICLGVKPSVIRSYRRALQTAGLFKTYLMLMATLLVGFALLIVPGIIVSVLYVFTLQVAVIEKRAGWNAMRRSQELGKGNYLRNFGVYFTCYLIVYFGLIIVVIAVVIFLEFVTNITREASELVGESLGLIIGPLLMTPYILLYYDMRARKEGYGAMQLAEDLRV